MVVVPAVDGVYVLFAINHDYPEVFENIAWEKSEVYWLMLTVIKKLKRYYSAFNALSNIDRPDNSSLLDDLSLGISAA